MVPEQIDRMRLGWSREDLARYSGVSVASVYLIERIGSSTESDDANMRDALTRGLTALGSDPSSRESAIDEADRFMDRTCRLSSRRSQYGDQ